MSYREPVENLTYSPSLTFCLLEKKLKVYTTEKAKNTSASSTV